MPETIEVPGFAALARGFVTRRLEDGERVIMLHGRKRGAKPKYRSNLPHAGMWGVGRGYILVPHPQPTRLAQMLRKRLLAAQITTTDDAVMVQAAPEVIRAILLYGPARCLGKLRPRRKPRPAEGGF